MKKLLATSLLVTALLIPTLSLADAARDANEAYESGDYTTAERLYREALTNQPDNAKIMFNLANTLVQLGRTEEAIGLYEQFKASVDDPELKARADYNIGKLFSDQQKYDQALNRFRNALTYDPGDTAAKHNYELAKKKKEEQQKQEDQKDKKGDDNKDQDKNKQKNKEQQQKDQQKQNQKQDKNQQNQQNQDKQKQKKQQGQGENQKEDEQKKKSGKQQPRPNQISKADAQKILKALEKKEKDLLKRFKKQTTEPKAKNEKDW